MYSGCCRLQRGVLSPWMPPLLHSPPFIGVDRGRNHQQWRQKLVLNKPEQEQHYTMSFGTVLVTVELGRGMTTSLSSPPSLKSSRFNFDIGKSKRNDRGNFFDTRSAILWCRSSVLVAPLWQLHLPLPNPAPNWLGYAVNSNE